MGIKRDGRSGKVVNGFGMKLDFGVKIVIFSVGKVGVMCSWSESQKSRF